MKAWGYTKEEIANVPAQILSREEHQTLTNALRAKLPFGQTYKQDRVSIAYQEVYKDLPDYLKSIEHFFK